ncbi:MAG: hypothetical protein WAV25_03035, partial [Minisyncoccia bacterium]
MSEKVPEIRIVGGASTEKKAEVRESLEQAFSNHLESTSPQELEQLRKLEYPKSETELALINFANEETSRLMQEAGVEPYDIPVENFHIIPPELYKKVADKNSAASAFNMQQGIIFNAEYFRDNPVYFCDNAIHEILHLKAHFSVEVEEENGEVKKTPYREGVSVRAIQKDGFNGRYHMHFNGLHEAIVSETEKRFLSKLLDVPVLAKEREWLESDEAKELKKKLSDKKKIPEDDIVWIGNKGENDWEIITY